ncbi:MAG: DNA polymerase III subunit epsilon [Flammeovirgaceae bacterium]|nr:DNA polymerase III subunit epsilon [Flammeovirgaceae bacterium]MBE61417.1 DNA polymerase III subunit epsilon [Flammeovirgaceae bacterium]MBR09798.1 DNA polymerase III subunit epsilon [Rickettsiales bacterium]HCX20391.1 3'-5' exonuclease [Cytophagales bacterium]|tara:strand:+ start:1597 stop:2292 length:696 start_codon:yes stop_codon:yes gene_type:complete
MHDYLLFLDTETSGIPISLNAPINDLDNWPFVLQLAWVIYSSNGELIKKENHFVWEEEIFINESSTKVHGITHDELQEKGEDRKSVMRLLASDLRKYKPLIIGHFVEFDSKMVQVAFYRSGLKNLISQQQHFCTMLASKKYALAANSTYPKLEELYHRLFHEVMRDKHNAMHDAEATARCFFQLKEKGDITEQLINSQKLFTNTSNKKSTKFGCGIPVLIFILIGLISIWL